MPRPRSSLILLVVLLIGYGLVLLVERTYQPAPARWPSDVALPRVEGWTSEPMTVQSWGAPEPGAIVQKTYHGPNGITADLVIWSVPQPEAKTLFRKGPDRDFLGAGFTSQPAPSSIFLPPHVQGAGVVRQGNLGWLYFYAYGERRGLLGNGIRAWAFAEFDALLDRPNDYFLARVEVPYPSTNPTGVTATARLADALFRGLAVWYGGLD